MPRFFGMPVCAAAIMGALLTLLAAPATAGAVEPDCRDRAFRWSRETPKVNLRHVFCGEIGNGRPRGFHSVRLQETSEVVLEVVRRRDEGGGIYSAVVVFANGTRKLSTFFPDHCSFEQIVRSITYAVHNRHGPHREWGEIGPSAPTEVAEMFCLDNRGLPFEIRFGVLANGRVNTAFPN